MWKLRNTLSSSQWTKTKSHGELDNVLRWMKIKTEPQYIYKMQLTQHLGKMCMYDAY